MDKYELKNDSLSDYSTQNKFINQLIEDCKNW